MHLRRRCDLLWSLALSIVLWAHGGTALAAGTSLGWQEVGAEAGSANKDGFEDVEVRARALVDTCMGTVWVRVQLDPGSVRGRGTTAGRPYWMDGKRYFAPANVGFPRLDHGLYISGTLRAGAQQSARFRVLATASGGTGGCFSNSGDSVAIKVPSKDAEAFLSSVSVDFDSASTIASQAVESALRQQAREAARQEGQDKQTGGTRDARDDSSTRGPGGAATGGPGSGEAALRQALQRAQESRPRNPDNVPSPNAAPPRAAAAAKPPAKPTPPTTGTAAGKPAQAGGTAKKATKKSYPSSSSGSSSYGSSSSSSSSSSGGSGGSAGVVAGGVGGAGAIAAAGAAGSGSGSSSGSKSKWQPPTNAEYRDDGGPSTLVPVMGTLGITALTTGLFFAFGYGLNDALSGRAATALGQRVEAAQAACQDGDAAACTEQTRWTRWRDDQQQGRLAWDTDTLLGPGVAYSFGTGYMQATRRGLLTPGLPVGGDPSMGGVTVEAALRLRLLRFDLGYHHLRGDLIDAGSNTQLTSQGLNGFVAGAALQPGWHHLPSPYLGIQYRVESLSGNVRLTSGKTRDQISSLSNFEGRRLLGTAGVTVNLPPAHHGTMFKAASLNFAYFQALDDGPLESGFSITFGGSTWLPASISALDGLTAMRPDMPNQRNSIVTPFALWGGLGLQVMTFETRKVSFNLFDSWLAPGESGWDRAGFALCGVGPVWRQAEGRHAVSLRLSPLALMRDTRDGAWTRTPTAAGEAGVQTLDGGDQRARLGNLRVWGLGAATLSWRAQVNNHTVEAGLKMPLAWWTNRKSNTFGMEDGRWYDGGPPAFLFAGYGY